MNFRQLTDNECLLNREMMQWSSRTALESKVLQSLESAKAAFKGEIKVCPMGMTAEQAKGGLQGPTASQREAINKRIRESGGVVRD